MMAAVYVFVNGFVILSIMIGVTGDHYDIGRSTMNKGWLNTKLLRQMRGQITGKCRKLRLMKKKTKWRKKKRFLSSIGAPKSLLDSGQVLLHMASLIENTNTRLEEQQEIMNDLECEITELNASISDLISLQDRRKQQNRRNLQNSDSDDS